MTGLRGRRAAAVAVLLIMAGVGAVVAQQAPGPFYVLDKTYCGPCHATWTPPLKEMAVIIPPATTGAAIGTEFNYTVRFQQSWNPKPSVPELQYVRPVLDLTAAPSLRFGGAPPDVNGAKTHSAIAIDSKRLNEGQENLTRVLVASGVTSLSWTLTPSDTTTTGPDLALLYKGPGGNLTVVDENHQPGSTERHNFTAAELATLGGGNWTVGARVSPVAVPDPTHPVAPQARRVEFDITEEAKFDTSSFRVLPMPADTVVKGGGVYLQKWVLKFVAAPAQAEEIRIGFNMTAYYEHRSPEPGGDYGNIALVPLAVPAQMQGGAPVLFFEGKSIMVRPTPVNGATLTTVSEAVGYASAFLLISSIVSGGMFGQASRRGLNSIFQSAKRRVAFHNFLSYGLTVAALVHMVIFLVPLLPGGAGDDCNQIVHLCRPSQQFQWTLGVLWGGGAILAMFALGVTGAFQVPMIRRWSYPTWKWWHYGLTVAAIALTVVHGLLDGNNFHWAQEAVGWRDPLYNPTGGAGVQ